MSSKFLRQCRPALGTLVEIALHEDDLPAAPRAQQAVFDAAFSSIAEVQQQMSFHDRDSALSRLNRTAPGCTLMLPAGLFEVLTLAQQLFEATGGRFDCGVADRLVKVGLLPAHDFLTAAGGNAQRSSIAHLQLHPQPPSATVTGPLCIDLGGIAKGFAVDQAIAAITGMGVARCIVNAGGDLRTAGDCAQQIFVRHPAAPGQSVLLGELSDGAVATSAPYFSTIEHQQQTYCALFDPHTSSLTRSVSYTVLAPTCAVADALTKAIAVCYNRNPPPASAAAAAGAAPAMTAPQEFHAGFLDTLQARAYILS